MIVLLLTLIAVRREVKL